MTILQEKLEAYYCTHLLRNTTIANFTSIADGWETEVYSFTLQDTDTPSDYILRMYPGEFAAEKCIREFNGIAKLYIAGYPVPQVYYHGTDASILGKAFIIMEKINGTPMGHLMLKSEVEAFSPLNTQFCQLLVDLHALDTASFAEQSLPDDPYYFVRSKVEMGRQNVERLGALELLPLLEWLEARIETVPCIRPSVTHNDFHPLNILRVDADKAYVIDWGNIEVTDFRFDLAWTMMLFSTYGYAHRRDAVLKEYERILGQPVKHIEVFEVYAAARRLFDMSISIRMGPENLGMRPEAVAAMKSQRSHFEAVYQCLVERSGVRIPELETVIHGL